MAYSEATKLRIIELHSQGEGNRAIARVLKISESGVRKFFKNIENRHTVDRKAGSKRPHKLNERAIRALSRTVLKNPLMTLRELGQYHGISASTASRMLKKSGIQYISRAPRFTIGAVNKRKRREWAADHRGWTTAQWSEVIFSDEVSISWNVGRIHVWSRSRNPKIFSHLMRTQFPIKRMFWGYITANGIGALVPIDGTLNTEKYIEVLNKTLFRRKSRRRILFQHDNSRVHTAANEWLDTKGVDVLPWPAQSPDCNPIENLWGIIKKKIQSKFTVEGADEDRLVRLTLEAWNSIEPVTIERLYESMPQRIAALRASRGAPIKY